MEEQKDMFALLDLMLQPVFCVKNNVIVRANAAARQLLPEPDICILPLLGPAAEEYEAFSQGCLYLPLTIADQIVGATVRRVEDVDIFELDSAGDSSALQALTLAAGTLRKPLSGALANTASLLDTQEDPEILAQLAQLNRNLHQILRTLGNMSDAQHVSSHCQMETTDAAVFFREIFEKAQHLISQSGVSLSYEGLKESVFCQLDRSLVERAVLNILANSAKFTPKGGTITASLVRHGRTLRLTVQDSGSGIDREILGNLFQRHLRQPGIEDSRFGLGLGLQLVHAAARHHGGTLLLSGSSDGGTRVVLTIAICQGGTTQMRSPIFEIDYTGGIDHSLVELSECLPAELFDGSY